MEKKAKKEEQKQGKKAEGPAAGDAQTPSEEGSQEEG
jgi:hypothetical protein